MREAALEAREVAGLASTQVMLLPVELEPGGRLGPHLEEADHRDDLRLARRRQRVPLIGGAARGGDVAEADRR